MRDPVNLEQVCLLEPDLLGYIFYPGSKRYVGDDPDPALFTLPPEGVTKVGVFVNEEISRINRIAEACRLDMVQLHGDETAACCRMVQDTGVRVIKALNPFSLIQDAGNPADSSGVAGYEGVVDYLLFDTPGAGYGGTGRQFDWGVLRDIPVTIPFLLSGGIGPGDAGRIRSLHHEALAGVDVNSRFEISPGVKDVKLLAAFMQEVRNNNQENSGT